MAKSKCRVVYWFRTDLRLHDSPALKAALDLDPEVFWPIWTWDPHYVYRARVGPNRWQFLLDSQNDLSNSITKLNKNSKLFVIREAPQTLFPKLFKKWKVTHLVFEKDTDAYARSRDEVVMKAAKEAGVEVVMRSGRTLWDSDSLVKSNNRHPTMTITQVQNAGPKIGAIPRPILAPESIPDPGDLEVDFEHEQPEQLPDLNSGARTQKDKSYTQLAGPNNDFAPPTLKELGIKEATTSHRGGESKALKQLSKLLEDKKYIATFEKPNTAPTDFEPQATTLLSPFLHFGCLSVREFFWGVQDILDGYSKKSSEPPVSLTGQLFFRDMYFGAQASIGFQFSQTVHNEHCRFIPWHLQSKVDPETQLMNGEYEIDSDEAEEWFQRWKEGRTGFPWIDALMRQLRQEGWIHHLGRHAVACFLTRGGCYISWERGAEVFEELLLDHETACNAGNWQWLSCTAFYSMYYRMYSPVAFPQKWDKSGAFVRRYVPELRDLDDKYIYEPWKAPLTDQKRAGVRIEGKGEDPDKKGTYPKPMFDFAQRRQICLDRMKEAYHVGLYGADPKVVDGSWRELFGLDDKGDGGTEKKTKKNGKDKKSKEEEDEDGEEEDGEDENEESGHGSKDESKTEKKIESTKGSRRPKRKVSGQGTLDGHFSKKVEK